MIRSSNGTWRHDTIVRPIQSHSEGRLIPPSHTLLFIKRILLLFVRIVTLRRMAHASVIWFVREIALGGMTEYSVQTHTSIPYSFTDLKNTLRIGTINSIRRHNSFIRTAHCRSDTWLIFPPYPVSLIERILLVFVRRWHSDQSLHPVLSDWSNGSV